MPSLQPFFYFCLCAVYTASLNGQPFCNGCPLAGFLYFLYCAGKSAAFMGAERVDHFSVSVEILQKCVNRHRHISPVVGVAQIDFIIFLKSFWHGGQFWSCFCLQIFLCLGNTGVIVRGIRNFLLYFKQEVSAYFKYLRRALNFLCDISIKRLCKRINFTFGAS